jgi:hypothetical protein
LGWHTFRRTYRVWLDDTGAPMTVQQQFMRSRKYPDHNERLWKRYTEYEKGGEEQDRAYCSRRNKKGDGNGLKGDVLVRGGMPDSLQTTQLIDSIGCGGRI